MNVMDAFPSKYLKASDLQGREITVKISHIMMEEIGQDKQTKPALYFMGKEKGIILNKTNATNISAAYGPDTDEWAGKSVVLFTAWVDMQGKSVEAIRVRPAAGGSIKPPVGKPNPKQTGDGGGQDEMSDEVPF
jgi:hypothetical protein